MTMIEEPMETRFMVPPFKMRVETDMERYRYTTWDTKEPETIAWIDSFNPHDVFFDVGANVGVYSLYAASRYPWMEIAAFEPMGITFDSLQHNAEKLNEFYNIHCWNRAIGNRVGLTYLDIPKREALRPTLAMFAKNREP